MTIAVALGRKATKQTNKIDTFHYVSSAWRRKSNIEVQSELCQVSTVTFHDLFLSRPSDLWWAQVIVP